MDHGPTDRYNTFIEFLYVVQVVSKSSLPQKKNYASSQVSDNHGRFRDSRQRLLESRNVIVIDICKCMFLHLSKGNILTVGKKVSYTNRIVNGETKIGRYKTTDFKNH